MTARARFRLEIVSRASGPVRITESATVDLPRPAPMVWAFMWDPASAVALSDTAVLGGQLPGTPDGVGEIQVFVHQGDNSRHGSMLEVVAMEPGRRVTRAPLGPMASRR
jgi:hypothetical protein